MVIRGFSDTARVSNKDNQVIFKNVFDTRSTPL
jgi:hypothetical protein